VNIVILMGGSSSSFFDEGHKFCKPLIEVGEDMIIEAVVNNLNQIIEPHDRIIFIIKQEDNEKFHLKNVIKLLAPDSEVVELKYDTDGAACSALLASEYIEDDEELLIVNGDQIIEYDLKKVRDVFAKKEYDAGVITFDSVHPRWSYVVVNDDNEVIEVSEKTPISNHATAGFYYYKKGKFFLEGAQAMIIKGASVDGIYYVCPVFNQLVLKGKKITTFNISAEKYHSLMSPNLVNSYIKYLETKK
jgi:dTDP-glucose pyrophosphorylase